jgi:hypothetical protein
MHGGGAGAQAGRGVDAGAATGMDAGAATGMDAGVAMGRFSNWADDSGVDAAQACCACGGGVTDAPLALWRLTVACAAILFVKVLSLYSHTLLIHCTHYPIRQGPLRHPQFVLVNPLGYAAPTKLGGECGPKQAL